jgi:hypothetical protein
MRKLTRVGLVAIALGAVHAPGVRADATLDDPPDVTAVVSHGGAQAWSRAAPGGGFELVLRIGGVARVAPVRARGVPFDVDLGPGADGRLTAVYSRCAREPDRFFGLPSYVNGRGCRLYRLDVASGAERRLGDGSPRRSDFLPSLWRGSVAFARTYGDRGPFLYLRRADGSVRRLRRGPRGRVRGLGPTRLDLAGPRLAVGWEHVEGRGAPSDGEGWGPGHVTSVFVYGVRGGRRLIDRTTAGERSRQLALPSLDGATLRYGLSVRGGPDEFRSIRLPGGRRQRSAAPSDLYSVAASGGVLAYSLFAFGSRAGGCALAAGTCRVALAG